MSNKKKLLLAASAATVGGSLAVWLQKFSWLAYDIESIRRFKRGQKQGLKDLEEKKYLINKFEENVEKYPDQIFIIFEDREYSYFLVNKLANKVANAAARWGLQQGDTVATMMYNEPAFIWTFLGLQKIGVATAFINYHLKEETLTHSLTDYLVQGDDLLLSMNEIREHLPADLPIYVYGKRQKELCHCYISMDDVMATAPEVEVSKSVRAQVNMRSPLCYIYTSGTTGLPKPAIINQAKAIGQYNGMIQLGLKHDDVMYVVTPLYHSSATCVGLFNIIGRGATIVLARKFSVHRYWEDVRRYHVTCLLYIGELCRYLLKQPEHDLDGQHKVRFAYGNGLRKDIWTKFKTRFKIPEIHEFFGATEGTAVTVNVCQRPGAMGRYSPITRRYIRGRQGVSIQIVKFDPITKELVRNKDGWCSIVSPGEEGIIISGIPPSHSKFYLGLKEEDSKKTVYDAFEKGDKYFNFGDVVYLDHDYFVYFRDRTGDTFRWKGENVSTIEVANILGMLDFIQDVNVYGVQIPGSDGRAGMAAILLKKDQPVTDAVLCDIYKHCRHHLPSYACPIFLRFVDAMILTQTMKLRKIELIEEGIDLNKIPDPVYVVNTDKQSYKPLTKLNYSSVISSRL
ncbi:hypothetical protein FSP39_004216 [Pinctada imbricata]|uniref:long-chain-fatty-acid--CoA ligase n=1 Tax=Pinctada imbricata TaxID=66713 RepID=A0AA89BSE5_PINIB|nr:hypothetical protein FSP39_004216 [Pinctada imbricata]